MRFGDGAEVDELALDASKGLLLLGKYLALLQAFERDPPKARQTHRFVVLLLGVRDLPGQLVPTLMKEGDSHFEQACPASQYRAAPSAWRQRAPAASPMQQ
jgi:hypothetical protein